MDQFNCITTHPTHIRGYNLDTMWKQLTESSEITARRTAVEEFNAANKWKKRGISMVPMRYGLSHGLNAGTTCLVSIHASGGTVDVHHGGTEIGQGARKAGDDLACQLRFWPITRATRHFGHFAAPLP